MLRSNFVAPRQFFFLLALLAISQSAVISLSAQEKIKRTPLNGEAGRLYPRLSKERLCLDFGFDWAIGAVGKGKTKQKCLKHMKLLNLDPNLLVDFDKPVSAEQRMKTVLKIHNAIVKLHGRDVGQFFEFSVKATFATTIYKPSNRPDIINRNRNLAKSIESIGRGIPGLPKDIFKQFHEQIRDSKLPPEKIIRSLGALTYFLLETYMIPQKHRGKEKCQSTIKRTPLDGIYGKLMPTISKELICLKLGFTLSKGALAHAKGNKKASSSYLNECRDYLEILGLERRLIHGYPKRQGDPVNDHAEAIRFINRTGGRVIVPMSSKHGMRTSSYFAFGVELISRVFRYAPSSAARTNEEKARILKTNHESASILEKCAKAGGIPKKFGSPLCKDFRDSQKAKTKMTRSVADVYLELIKTCKIPNDKKK